MADPRSHRRYIERRNAAKRAFAKQNAPCWLCGGAIDYNAAAGAPNSFDLDHRTAIASGGSLMDLKNWAASHARCNRSKQAKNADDYRAEQAARKPAPTRRTTRW